MAGDESGTPTRRAVLRVVGWSAAATATGVTIGGVTGALGGGAAVPATAKDAWSPLIPFRTVDGRYAAPIHVTLLPSGDLHLMGGAKPTPGPDPDMIFSRYAFSTPPHRMGTPFPTEVTGRPLPEPMDITNEIVGEWLITDDLFCAGHSLLADGRFFTAGGIQNWKKLTPPDTTTTTTSTSTTSTTIPTSTTTTSSSTTSTSTTIPVSTTTTTSTPTCSPTTTSTSTTSTTAAPTSTTMPTSTTSTTSTTMPTTTTTDPTDPNPPDVPDDPDEELVFTGLPYATIMEVGGWRRVEADMVGHTPRGQPRRWYPTVTRLPGGRMLVTSGNDEIYPVFRVNLSVEVFDPATETWSLLSDVDETPLEVWCHDYSHVFVLPNAINTRQMLVLGELGIPVLHTLSTPVKWKVSTAIRPGGEAFDQARRANCNRWVSDEAPMSGASTCLLPIRQREGEWGYGNGSVLVTGGPHESMLGSQVDVYDPTVDAWKPPLDTGVMRHDPMTVLLPDGKVLVIGGAGDSPDVQRTHYVDPARGFRITPGTTASGALRSYHAVAALLPDGRVFVGGGRDTHDKQPWTEKPNGQYYYPPYLYVARPSITSSPKSVAPNAAFTVTAKGVKPVEAVLMGLGSQTHCFDANQRYVQLKLGTVTGTADAWTLPLTAPARTWAPPGFYLLFVLDQNRTPSVAAFLRLLP